MTCNKIEHFIKVSPRFFAAFAFLGFIVLTLACKDKAETPQHECPVAHEITIKNIKENYEALSVRNPVLKGTIIESQDVKKYTYLHLKDSTGQIWAAIPKTPVEIGKDIAISDIIVMKDFDSKTLDKTFDIILFALPSKESKACPLPHGEGEMPGGMMSEMPPGMMPEGMPHAAMPAEGMGMGKDKAVPQDIKVSKAAGKDAYTIEEIYSKKKDLSQKTVRVRAKVVKFLPQIMGKNWVHIQDGTGSAENDTYDLAVSTLDTADVGDEVIVDGTLGVDKDFGSMCTFSVIVEDASVKKVE